MGSLKPITLAILTGFSVSVASATPSHGIQETTVSGTFIVPKGVKAISFEIWGGGGGGGTGNSDGQTAVGGTGGSGSYVRGTIPVKASQQLTINVGAAGTAGIGISQVGGSGGASQILAGNVVLASAGGGNGGGPAALDVFGSNGLPGVPVETPGFLTRPGHYGPSGSAAPAVQGSIEIPSTIEEPISVGGRGGNGAVNSTDGRPGGRGHVILSW